MSYSYRIIMEDNMKTSKEMKHPNEMGWKGIQKKIVSGDDVNLLMNVNCYVHTSLWWVHIAGIKSMKIKMTRKLHNRSDGDHLPKSLFLLNSPLSPWPMATEEKESNGRRHNHPVHAHRPKPVSRSIKLVARSIEMVAQTGYSLNRCHFPICSLSLS